VIKAKVELGLSAQRIYQDLVGENGFSDSYQSVKRFVRKLRTAQPERIWRLECQPGEELQLDFGLGAPIDDGQSKKRRSWVLRMVLSYSRKAYSEAVTPLTTSASTATNPILSRLGSGGLHPNRWHNTVL
jgi:hypothetical protein